MDSGTPQSARRRPLYTTLGAADASSSSVTPVKAPSALHGASAKMRQGSNAAGISSSPRVRRSLDGTSAYDRFDEVSWVVDLSSRISQALQSPAAAPASPARSVSSAHAHASPRSRVRLPRPSREFRDLQQRVLSRREQPPSTESLDSPLLSRSGSDLQSHANVLPSLSASAPESKQTAAEWVKHAQQDFDIKREQLVNSRQRLLARQSAALDVEEHDEDSVDTANLDPAVERSRLAARSLQELMQSGGLVDEEAEGPPPFSDLLEQAQALPVDQSASGPSALFSAHRSADGTVDIESILQHRAQLAEQERPDQDQPSTRPSILELGAPSEAPRRPVIEVLGDEQANQLEAESPNASSEDDQSSDTSSEGSSDEDSSSEDSAGEPANADNSNGHSTDQIAFVNGELRILPASGQAGPGAPPTSTIQQHDKDEEQSEDEDEDQSSGSDEEEDASSDDDAMGYSESARQFGSTRDLLFDGPVGDADEPIVLSDSEDEAGDSGRHDEEGEELVEEEEDDEEEEEDDNDEEEVDSSGHYMQMEAAVDHDEEDSEDDEIEDDNAERSEEAADVDTRQFGLDAANTAAVPRVHLEEDADVGEDAMPEDEVEGEELDEDLRWSDIEAEQDATPDEPGPALHMSDSVPASFAQFPFASFGPNAPGFVSASQLYTSQSAEPVLPHFEAPAHFTPTPMPTFDQIDPEILGSVVYNLADPTSSEQTDAPATDALRTQDNAVAGVAQDSGDRFEPSESIGSGADQPQLGGGGSGTAPVAQEVRQSSELPDPATAGDETTALFEPAQQSLADRESPLTHAVTEQLPEPHSGEVSAATERGTDLLADATNKANDVAVGAVDGTIVGNAAAAAAQGAKAPTSEAEGAGTPVPQTIAASLPDALADPVKLAEFRELTQDDAPSNTSIAGTVVAPPAEATSRDSGVVSDTEGAAHGVSISTETTETSTHEIGARDEDVKASASQAAALSDRAVTTQTPKEAAPSAVHVSFAEQTATSIPVDNAVPREPLLLRTDSGGSGQLTDGREGDIEDNNSDEDEAVHDEVVQLSMSSVADCERLQQGPENVPNPMGPSILVQESASSQEALETINQATDDLLSAATTLPTIDAGLESGDLADRESSVDRSVKPVAAEKPNDSEIDTEQISEGVDAQEPDEVMSAGSADQISAPPKRKVDDVTEVPEDEATEDANVEDAASAAPNKRAKVEHDAKQSADKSKDMATAGTEDVDMAEVDTEIVAEYATPLPKSRFESTAGTGTSWSEAIMRVPPSPASSDRRSTSSFTPSANRHGHRHLHGSRPNLLSQLTQAVSGVASSLTAPIRALPNLLPISEAAEGAEKDTEDDQKSTEDDVETQRRPQKVTNEPKFTITTRSHCLYHELRLDSIAGSPTFVVPGCSINHEEARRESAIDVGEASEQDSDNWIDVDPDLLPDEVHHMLSRVIGLQILREGIFAEPGSSAARLLLAGEDLIPAITDKLGENVNDEEMADETGEMQEGGDLSHEIEVPEEALAAETLAAIHQPASGAASTRHQRTASDASSTHSHRSPRKSDPTSADADYLPDNERKQLYKERHPGTGRNVGDVSIALLEEQDGSEHDDFSVELVIPQHDDDAAKPRAAKRGRPRKSAAANKDASYRPTADDETEAASVEEDETEVRPSRRRGRKSAASRKVQETESKHAEQSDDSQTAEQNATAQPTVGQAPLKSKRGRRGRKSNDAAFDPASKEANEEDDEEEAEDGLTGSSVRTRAITEDENKVLVEIGLDADDAADGVVVNITKVQDAEDAYVGDDTTGAEAIEAPGDVTDSEKVSMVKSRAKGRNKRNAPAVGTSQPNAKQEQEGAKANDVAAEADAEETNKQGKKRPRRSGRARSQTPRSNTPSPSKTTPRKSSRKLKL
ncbi:hypothetical protein BCV70DRAFT_49980 [Testicularia cyperi]|uniref:Uncharacterized protein n=1 Tax=Testicularia cyperi TaxID=1882483 RepID=A0A317XGE9_9BASI|nr:hypothetical protein BCV70DRAFT_93002 [Testicularia cyperi]PWY97582.1 hypothetical protein BCV70DRAFT_49980 [Testicularia cyperi]